MSQQSERSAQKTWETFHLWVKGSRGEAVAAAEQHGCTGIRGIIEWPVKGHGELSRALGTEGSVLLVCEADGADILRWFTSDAGRAAPYAVGSLLLYRYA